MESAAIHSSEVHEVDSGIPMMRIPVDTRSLIPVISVHSISNLLYRRQS